MKYVISYEKTIQVSEDSWRVILKTFIANENTTIGQIRDWYEKDKNSRLPFLKMDDIKISEPVEANP